MGRFWVGSDEGYDHAADVRYGRGRVWIGSDEGYDHSADARYGNGRIWIGSDEGYDHAADARYGNGRLWIGSDGGYDHAADARYGDGRAWVGSDEGYDHAAAGRYDAEGGGAAAATFLALLGAQAAIPDDAAEPEDDDVADSTNSYTGSTSSSSSGGYSPSSSSSSSSGGGLGGVGTIILIVIGFAIWSDSKRPTAPAVAPTSAVSPGASDQGPGTARWNVGALPVTRGLRSKRPMISSLDLIDSKGQPVPYKVQYVPSPFLTYIADHLKARRATTLFGAPDGFGSSEAQVAVAIDEMVEILEAFSIVEWPRALVAQRDVNLIYPFTVSTSAPEGRGFPVKRGTTIVAVQGTSGECSVFLVSGAGFYDLCWPSSTDGLTDIGGPTRVRTAFLVRLESGGTAWTRFVREDDPAEKWLAADWIACNTVYRGTEREMTCGQ